MARHRPAAKGGYQCGEETRARIIDAALHLFGERGYEGASTRDIAKEAGVNAPALQYYFDGKEGVYLACIELFVARVWEHLDGVVSDAESVSADPEAADPALMDAYLAIQARFASFVSDKPEEEVNHWRMFMARERAGLGPAAAFDIIDKGLNRRIFAATSGVIGRLLGKPAGDEETKIRTLAIDGQVLVFRMMRRQAISALGWQGFGSEETARISKIILEQTRELLAALVRAREARRAELASESH
jgi:AcrR family transcriptional regulator